MLITLYGADSYRRLRKLREIINAYTLKQGNFSKERFSLAQDPSWESLQSFLSNQSMFSTKKLIILDEPFEFGEPKALKELLKQYVESKDTTIVINTTKKHPTTFKFIEEAPNKFEEFSLLKGRELINFIKKESDALKIPLSMEQLNSIATTIGSDTWKIATELEQTALRRGKTMNTGSLWTPAEYFPSLNALKRGHTVKEKLIALEKLIGERGEDPGRVFNGLAYQLKDANEAQIYADYDVAVKSGKLEYEEVLLAIALELNFSPLD